MKNIKIIFPVLLSISLLSLALQCGKSKEVAIQDKVVPVAVADVSSKVVSIPIHGSGMLFSKKQIRLSFKTGGFVEKINVREGQNVQAGHILAQLALDEIQAQVQQAQSGFEKAERDFTRVGKLYADSVATLEQLQNVETQLNVARSNLKIAQFNLEHSTIKAPADGRILKRFVEQNELVGPGTPVFYFGSGRQDWLVRAGLSDRDIVKVQIGDSAAVFFDAYPNINFPATVSEVAQAADPQNGTFEVEVQVDAQGQRLAAGFVAQVMIFPQSNESRTLIPVSALVDARGTEAFVYTINKNSAQKRPVTTGAIIGEHVIITSGLENVNQVITAGAAYLRDGDKVSVQ
jgi:RND family efflux transporter MFP subunit